jgi:hypothetical protein
VQLVARPRHEHATKAETRTKLVLQTEARHGVRNVEDVLGREGRALGPWSSENDTGIEAIVWSRDAIHVYGLGLGHRLLVTVHDAYMRRSGIRVGVGVVAERRARLLRFLFSKVFEAPTPDWIYLRR